MSMRVVSAYIFSLVLAGSLVACSGDAAPPGDTGDGAPEGTTTSTTLVDPNSDPASETEAGEALADFLGHMGEGRYAEAAALYGGSYELLAEWNPGLDPQDHAALLENGCTVNGLQCLRPMSVTLEASATGTYGFLVEFAAPDGSLFVGAPGEGESTSPQSEFAFTVVADDGDGYLVQELPPYLP